MTIQEERKEERVGERMGVGWGCGEGRQERAPRHLSQAALCSRHSTMRTKVYAVLELWVQVCGASAGVLQGGASGEALLTHLLSDISPPADALKVSEAAAPVPWPHPVPLVLTNLVTRCCPDCPAFLWACVWLMFPSPPAAQSPWEP